MTTGQTTKQRTRKKPSRTLTIAGMLGAAALIVAVLWASMAHSGQPSQQQRVAVPGAGEHLVNFWAEPAETDGGRRLTAQVTDTGGWPAGVGSVVFSVTGADQGTPVEALGAYSPDGPGRGQVYHATLGMPGTGPWQVAVRFTMGGQRGDAVFTVEPE